VILVEEPVPGLHPFDGWDLSVELEEIHAHVDRIEGERDTEAGQLSQLCRRHEPLVLVHGTELGPVSDPILRPNLMLIICMPQESSIHTYCTKNGYRITNVTIYNIYYQIVSYKRQSRTLLEAS
jgi:hypothetical protein